MQCSSTSCTLFPEWFDWFRSQRHVRNALQHGHELRTARPARPHTPLTGGQVDDTPFGGGAGMVLRVDVMDAGPARASTASTPSSCARGAA